MALPTVFYCNPTKAAELGYTFSKTYTLSTTQATQMRNAYEALEAGQATATAIIISLLGMGLKGGLAAIYIVSTTLSVSYVSDYMQTLDNDFDTIATSGTAYNNVICTYSYVRHSSNDGAYFLSSVKIA